MDYRCVTPAARGASSVDTDEVDGVKADAVRVCLPELSDASSGASRSTKDVPAVCLPPEELEEDFLASVPTPAGKE